MEHISKHLTAPQNMAVVRSTTLPELSTDENKLKDAVQEQKIKFLSDEEMKPMMLYVYTLIGLRGENYPAGLDKDFIHTYIREYYGGHTVSEVRLAFTMAIQKKLGVDATAFEFFNAAYFTKIMDAYRKWAVETVHSLPVILPAKELPPAKTTDAEFIEACYNLYKSHKDYKQIPVMVYDCLKLNLTIEEKWKISKTVIDTNPVGSDMKELSKQMAVALYFDTL